MNFEHGRSTTVRTDKGYVRGFKHNGIYHFYGMDYAYAERYEVPRECENWEGVKEATNYGFICHQSTYNYMGNHIKNPYRYWPVSDHCQNLNVWTRDLNPEMKKPVVFWLHGGGFANGSSIEHVAYDGFNLAKYKDLCVVTINHRLNALGYLDLSSFGEKYARTGNLGMLDIIKALEWVKRNIAQFGGDPDNVTIIGQSGGGGKVHTLMNMPAADGLYHKAMIMSGAMETKGVEAVIDHRPIVLRAMEIMGVNKDEVEKLETCDARALIDAINTAAKEVKAHPLFLSPRRNEDYLGDASLFGYSEYSKKIPLVIGGTFAEFKYQFNTNYREADYTDEQAFKIIAEKYEEEKAKKIAALFTEVFPEKRLVDFLNLETSMFRAGTKEYIARRIQDDCAPTWNYLFAPICGINERSTPVHSYEIPFFFHNTELIPSNDLGGDVTDKVELQCSERLANYARYGTPILPGQIEWPKCTNEETPTLIIDNITRVVNNYDDEIVKIIKSE